MTRIVSVALVVCSVIFFITTNPHPAFAQDQSANIIVGYVDGHNERVTVSNTLPAATQIFSYVGKSDVSFIEREYFYQQTAIPNDTHWLSEATLSQISAPAAWDYETGNSGVTVAILDSGVDTTHEDLKNNIVTGWDFVDNDSDPNPEYNSSSLAAHHGTVIAGIIGAQGNNSQGVAGITWDISLMPIRVLNEFGVGSSYDVSNGITYAMNNGADIINLSFIGDTSSLAIMKAIQAARNRGVIVIAAAGNNNINLNTTPMYPVCNIGVIGVASVNASGAKSSFSNYGSDCVDISAPGEGVYSTIATGSESTLSGSYSGGWSGTSFAAPHVAGVAALAKAHDPDIQIAQLETLLTSVAYTSISSVNGSLASHLGSGLISALKAVSASSPPLVEGNTILTFPLSGGGPHLRGFTKTGANYMNSFLESSDYHGGGSIASGDIDADGENEILYGLGSGTTSRVRIFTKSGVYESEFLAYSSPENGIRVASGDTDGDGDDEIITVREAGASADIRIFNAQGTIQKRFFSYPASFRGGMSIASGDVTGDGIDEIIVGTGSEGLPRVQVFTEDGVRLYEFFAYGLGFRGGINVATGDVDGDSIDEIITAPIAHGGPHVRTFEKDGTLIGQFFAYGQGFHGGVSVSSADINGDGKDDIITGARRGGGPHVLVWSNPHGTQRISNFFAYGEGFHGGIDVLGLTQ